MAALKLQTRRAVAEQGRSRMLPRDNADQIHYFISKMVNSNEFHK